MYYPPVNHLVAISIIILTVAGLQCLCPNNLYFNNDPKVKNSDAGNFVTLCCYNSFIFLLVIVNLSLCLIYRYVCIGNIAYMKSLVLHGSRHLLWVTAQVDGRPLYSHKATVGLLLVLLVPHIIHIH
jgi:hypothetical protein